VLPQQHNHAREQPLGLLFKDWLRDRFISTELDCQFLKLF
jgi:hypothetical protein